METLLTIQQAAQIARLPENILIDMCERGKIQANKFNGVVLVNETDVLNNAPIEQQPEYQQFTHLAGVGISISEAARNYHVPQQTISRWVKRGWIKVISTMGRKTLIDESHIAYYGTVYNKHSGGQGKWIFGRSGKLYSKQSKRNPRK